jgi:hypothetical protein
VVVKALAGTLFLKTGELQLGGISSLQRVQDLVGSMVLVVYNRYGIRLMRNATVDIGHSACRGILLLLNKSRCGWLEIKPWLSVKRIYCYISFLSYRC